MTRKRLTKARRYCDMVDATADATRAALDYWYRHCPNRHPQDLATGLRVELEARGYRITRIPKR